MTGSKSLLDEYPHSCSGVPDRIGEHYLYQDKADCVPLFQWYNLFPYSPYPSLMRSSKGGHLLSNFQLILLFKYSKLICDFFSIAAPDSLFLNEPNEASSSF